MNNQKQFSHPLTGFTVFVIVLVLLNIAMNLINHRFYVSDFRVYYMAADNLVHGGEIYFQKFGDDAGIYKYSPFTLFFFVPFSFLRFEAAALIYLVLLGFCFWYAYVIIRKLFGRYFFPEEIKYESLLLAVAAIGSVIHLVKELYLGNCNILLVMICLLALDLILSGKSYRGGILLGLVFLTKPFFLLLILPLILRKQFKAVYGIIFSVLAGFIIPFPVLGYSRAIAVFSGWFRSLLVHDAGYPGAHTLDYFLRHNFFPGLPKTAEIVIIAVCGLLMIWFIIASILREKKYQAGMLTTGGDFLMEWIILLAVIPNLVKTDSEHFLASAPVITFIVYYIWVKRAYILIPLMAVIIFFFGANSNDLLGYELSDKLYYAGLIGLSNLVLILTALLLFFRLRKTGTDKVQKE